MPERSAEQREALVARLQKSRKYSAICEDTLTRTAEWALARHPATRSAEKAAKRKLHQVSAAYAGTDTRGLVDRLNAWDGRDEKDFCRSVMMSHASTQERLPILEEACGEILRRIPRPNRLIDLACGLNVFTLPWLDPDRSLEYVGIECDGCLVEAGNAYLSASGRSGELICGDLLGADSVPQGDVYVLLKALPCLDQQAPGSAFAVLERLSGCRVVVSYPVKSLGGRGKGMPAHYDAALTELADRLALRVETIRFPQETFYFLEPEK